MSQEKATELAVALMRLGVSNRGLSELLNHYPYDVIELQLKYLPFRKAKRPEAFIIEAVRRNYSAPKEFFHASNQAHPSRSSSAVDQAAKRPARPTPPQAQGHRTSGPTRPHSPNARLEPGGSVPHHFIRNPDQANGPTE